MNAHLKQASAKSSIFQAARFGPPDIIQAQACTTHSFFADCSHVHVHVAVGIYLLKIALVIKVLVDIHVGCGADRKVGR